MDTRTGLAARRYERSKRVPVLPMVVVEGEFVEVQRQYFFETLWKLPTIPRVSSDQVRREDDATHVLAFAVVDALVRRIVAVLNGVVAQRLIVASVAKSA
jgi:hypothetical protein